MSDFSGGNLPKTVDVTDEIDGGALLSAGREENLTGSRSRIFVTAHRSPCVRGTCWRKSPSPKGAGSLEGVWALDPDVGLGCGSPPLWGSKVKTPVDGRAGRFRPVVVMKA